MRIGGIVAGAIGPKPIADDNLELDQDVGREFGAINAPPNKQRRRQTDN